MFVTNGQHKNVRQIAEEKEFDEIVELIDEFQGW